MSSDLLVHSWPCSYYLDLEKQWVPGKLTLTPHSLKFNVDKSEEVLVGLPLSSITEIKKETSLFIFSAITVVEKGQAKHWFSSLQPSRDVVFNIIEHFWREVLFYQPDTANTASPKTRGQELIKLMESSRRRMEDTAKDLDDQTEQLDSVLRGLEKMESDLDVADRWARSSLPLLGRQYVLWTVSWLTHSRHLEERLCTHYADCVGLIPESHCLSSRGSYWFIKCQGAGVHVVMRDGLPEGGSRSVNAVIPVCCLVMSPTLGS